MSFSFIQWAKREKFDYPKEAQHLFLRLDSAAEAFFLRPFSYGISSFTPTSVVGLEGELFPQFQLGPYSENGPWYRVDFLFRPRCHGLRAVIEIDGKPYHHQKEAQIDADYRRQRVLTSWGLKVIRFTAREVFADASACWREVVETTDTLATMDDHLDLSKSMSPRSE